MDNQETKKQKMNTSESIGIDIGTNTSESISISISIRILYIVEVRSYWGINENQKDKTDLLVCFNNETKAQDCAKNIMLDEMIEDIVDQEKSFEDLQELKYESDLIYNIYLIEQKNRKLFKEKNTELKERFKIKLNIKSFDDIDLMYKKFIKMEYYTGRKTINIIKSFL